MSAALDPVKVEDLGSVEVRERYARDGVLYVPQALHPEWLMLIELGLQRVLMNSGQMKHKFFEDTPGEFIETVRNFEVTPEIQRLVYDSPVADMISALVDSEQIWLYSEEFFIKEGRGCERTPWHQDLPYWPLNGQQIGSVWISLDPVPQSECLELVRGSHRGTMYDGFDPSKVNVDPTAPYYDSELPPLPDIQAERDQWDIVAAEITPGDVVIFHPGVLHGGGPTKQVERRRAITVRCYGDDVVYVKRPDSRPTVPLTPGLSLALNPGDPLRHPYYPKLRPLPEHQRM
ncbi:MAG: phytanoyl-CoA dioxygenase family protein [Gammaproteobacteria bacterium]|nr:phytanoyl-CoA dioxygenase family protein [Gammaproteobacteria bacterium]